MVSMAQRRISRFSRWFRGGCFKCEYFQSFISRKKVFFPSRPLLLIRVREGRNLAGVLYFHQISDRWAKFHSEYLDYFQELCEGDLDKVIFITTKWHDVDNETGRRREEELKRVHLRNLLEHGASIQGFMNDRQSAINILSLRMNNWKILDVWLSVLSPLT